MVGRTCESWDLVDQKEYVEAFRSLQRAAGRRRVLDPDVAVRAWQSQVRSCEEGYDMGIDEYFNEMSVRRLLERAMNDERLAGFPETSSLRDQVSAADDQLRATFLEGQLIGDDGSPWWERGVHVAPEPSWLTTCVECMEYRSK